MTRARLQNPTQSVEGVALKTAVNRRLKRESANVRVHGFVVARPKTPLVRCCPRHYDIVFIEADRETVPRNEASLVSLNHLPISRTSTCVVTIRKLAQGSGDLFLSGAELVGVRNGLPRQRAPDFDRASLPKTNLRQPQRRSRGARVDLQRAGIQRFRRGQIPISQRRLRRDHQLCRRKTPTQLGGVERGGGLLAA